jgi:hypothetical protein
VAKAAKKTDAIEILLAEKSEIEQWLEKLNAAGSKTPEHVRAKVQGDYQARLDRVLEELQGFRDDIVSSLKDQEDERSRLRDVEAEASERYAEAELRHSVGEFNEANWAKLSGEIQAELDGVRGELNGVETEITKLKGIVALIDESPVAEPELDEVPEAEGEVADATAEAGDDEIAELEEADDEIADLPERPSHQTEAFDEMAFLKSVTEDEQGPSANLASGTHSAVDVVEPSSGKKIGAQGVEAVSNKEGGPARGKVKKSLKCGECGAKNLPTEWYCERCGAELAAL